VTDLSKNARGSSNATKSPIALKWQLLSPASSIIVNGLLRSKIYFSSILMHMQSAISMDVLPLKQQAAGAWNICC
jgi:hypothetical protein